MNKINLAGSPNVWEIDCKDVHVISHSFADECFAVLVQLNNTEWFADNIKLINLEDDARNSILEAIFMRMANEFKNFLQYQLDNSLLSVNIYKTTVR